MIERINHRRGTVSCRLHWGASMPRRRWSVQGHERGLVFVLDRGDQTDLSVRRRSPKNQLPVRRGFGQDALVDGVPRPDGAIRLQQAMALLTLAQ